MAKADTSPMMKQYEEAKKACPEALLFFRMGDFYELFFEDAKIAAKVLGLALTSRDKGTRATPMAGFPHHQLDGYLAKLIAAGHRVAVCEQVEDPKKAKGLVRREVTRLVSPGTVTEESILDPRECNYLVSITDTQPAGLAWADLSTGRFFAAVVPPEHLPDQIARLAPSECLVPESGNGLIPSHLGDAMMVTRRPDWSFGYPNAHELLTSHFRTTTLEGFGFSDAKEERPSIQAAGAILDYLQETQKQSLEHLDSLVPYHASRLLEIDESSRRSLEITRTLREGRREGTLLSVLDQCVTAMGSRLLSDWVNNPLIDPEEIETRLESVAELVEEERLTADLRELLRKVYDIERLLSRVATGRATPRDLNFIGRSLRNLPDFKHMLADGKGRLLAVLRESIDPCEELSEELERALVDDSPLTSREGGFIREGYHEELDAFRDLQKGGKEWIAQYQAKEMERTGIANLKVGFNRVFGYYLEVTNVHREKIPENYHRKQTLKNAERYITPELKEYEEKVLTADEKACALEYDLFVTLREKAARARPVMHRSAMALAHLDVLSSLATLARQRNYCRPTVTSDPVLTIRQGRHPVLDILEPEGVFVPNDTEMEESTRRIQLITGPNMAGKSTYIRQVALITLMAQIGSFVPAEEATVGVADRIFARVGASDELARGQSTFMVEMTETARILNMATSKSLVILDEIGRGTSTYDGISLAWAVVEHLHNQVACRTLFATHYHELTELAHSFEQIENYNVAVREWNDDVVFLHKIVPGAADKSYGIHVARLAGVPRPVVDRAKAILADLEEAMLESDGKVKISGCEPPQKGSEIQLTLFGPADHPLIDETRALNLEEMSPMEAMNWLHRWQRQLKQESTGGRKGRKK